ncbi:ATP-dependent RNA helicase DDX5/DBP2 [Angomonas deanei]|uniref:RNA helicase n=1 Tax=Angomonas deanei TaxID=59799 RepID=A0A7G2CGD1_9TRYP|nr:ATP-dependent RNA helicase DDX5/DBP2 [Angomonas deanei]CAD2218806.1 DEAD/DEAH box helicase/Type III restriction enzyme, res subunit/Helicase conserved C-terminal domain containing protein, putative [Angomonas deanei]|eukprot:EPY37467.1 ATP-dependent RNA helicase DDX5/DBP2 [Angomonas deanei]
MAYPSTTDIQKYTIPALEAGHDLIGLAPTGSGKTVAFAVPALRHVKQNKTGSPSVLVMAPTRELVQQTTKVFQQLTCGAIRVCEAYGGASRESQARRLHMGCEVLVACPGRLKDFLDAGDVSLKHLSFLVFDEADRLLDMGFKPQLDEILSFCDENTKRQTMMWSATWPEEVQGLARDFLSPNRLMIRAGTAGTGLQLNDHINQRVIYVESFNERIEKLIQMIEDGTINDNTDKLIIFVERQSDTENVCESLSQRLGIDRRYVGVIHGGLSQRQRDSVMHQFKQNYIRILVATDVAARGLDIPDVTFVINFQMPKNIDSYCHRIGRTGRAGRSGNACTFIGRGDGGTARQLVDYLQKCKMTVPDDLKVLAEKHNEERRNKFGSSSRGNFGGGRRGGYNNYNRNNSRGRNDQNRF